MMSNVWMNLPSEPCCVAEGRRQFACPPIPRGLLSELLDRSPFARSTVMLLEYDCVEGSPERDVGWLASGLTSRLRGSVMS